MKCEMKWLSFWQERYRENIQSQSSTKLTALSTPEIKTLSREAILSLFHCVNPPLPLTNRDRASGRRSWKIIIWAMNDDDVCCLKGLAVRGRGPTWTAVDCVRARNRVGDKGMGTNWKEQYLSNVTIGWGRSPRTPPCILQDPAHSTRHLSSLTLVWERETTNPACHLPQQPTAPGRPLPQPSLISCTNMHSLMIHFYIQPSSPSLYPVSCSVQGSLFRVSPSLIDPQLHYHRSLRQYSVSHYDQSIWFQTYSNQRLCVICINFFVLPPLSLHVSWRRQRQWGPTSGKDKQKILPSPKLDLGISIRLQTLGKQEQSTGRDI